MAHLDIPTRLPRDREAVRSSHPGSAPGALDADAGGSGAAGIAVAEAVRDQARVVAVVGQREAAGAARGARVDRPQVGSTGGHGGQAAAGRRTGWRGGARWRAVRRPRRDARRRGRPRGAAPGGASGRGRSRRASDRPPRRRAGRGGASASGGGRTCREGRAPAASSDAPIPRALRRLGGGLPRRRSGRDRGRPPPWAVAKPRGRRGGGRAIVVPNGSVDAAVNRAGFPGLAPDGTLQPHRAHRPGHRAPRHGDPFAPELPPDRCRAPQTRKSSF